MLFQPEVSIPLREVIVIVGITISPLGLVVAWFATLGISLKKGLERALLLIEKEDVGLIPTVLRNHREVQLTMGALGNEVHAVGTRVSVVEARCEMIQEAKQSSE